MKTQKLTIANMICMNCLQVRREEKTEESEIAKFNDGLVISFLSNLPEILTRLEVLVMLYIND